MKEIFASYQHVSMDSVKDIVLLDTCFLIDLMKHHKKWNDLPKNVGMTSFNAEEICFVEHRLGKELKASIRKFLKSFDLLIVDVDVHPGDRDGEKKFVDSIDRDLLSYVPDASDAVLMAAAIKTKSKVLTKDKHHLFTVSLENFLNKYDLKVYKNLKDLD